jgi:leucyl aminopeptidase
MTSILNALFSATRSVPKHAGNLVLGVEPKRPEAALAVVDEATAEVIRGLLARGDLDAKAGKVLALAHVPDPRFDRVLLVAMPGPEANAGDYRTMVGAAAAAVAALPGTRAVWALHAAPVRDQTAYHKVRAAVVALAAAVYRFDRHRSKPAEAAPTLRHVDVLLVPEDRIAGERGLAHGVALAEGMHIARDVGNEPPNALTPTSFASEARKVARAVNGGAAAGKLRVRVLGEKEMRTLGMGSFLSVGAGSREESKFILMEYKGGPARARPYVFVGKGITFDTGGISIKPAPAMDEMKYDMCGAASVLGLMHAVAALKLPLNVVGAIAAAENMPGGAATRPGDIVRSMSGQTIEILNTDAEGRLVLCDALTYVERYKPAAVVDIATLTGAVVVALGSAASGLWANDDELGAQLRSAGEAAAAADRVWPMPLWDDYQPLLKSNFADMANVSGGREAGSSVAACFLSRFTKAYPWAHLDVAGTAYRSGAQKGATARPVPLLLQYLLERAGALP